MSNVKNEQTSHEYGWPEAPKIAKRLRKIEPEVGHTVVRTQVSEKYTRPVSSASRYVIWDIKSYEDCGSCGYDREYELVSEEDIKDHDVIIANDLVIFHERVVGSELPFVVDTNVQKYKFTRSSAYKITRQE